MPQRRSAAAISAACLALALTAFAPGAAAQSQVEIPQTEIETALELYRYRLLQSGSRLRNYPPEAIEQQLEGTASMELIVAGDGSLKSLTLLSSSGHALLDSTALQMISAAVPLTQIPSTLQNKAFAVRMVIVFRLP